MKNKIIIAMAAIVALVVIIFTVPINVSDKGKLEYFLNHRGVKKSVYSQYMTVKDSENCTLQDVFATGIQDYKNSDRLGLIMCAPDDYQGVFGTVIDKIIDRYHKLGSGFNGHVSDLDVNKITNLEVDPNKEFIISTRIRVGRTLENLPFRRVQDLNSALETEKTISNALSKLKGKYAGKYHKLQDLSKDEIDKLIKEHVLFDDMKTSHLLRSSGIAYQEFAPQGSGVFFNEDKSIIAWVNEEDHLRIISLKEGGSVKEVFSNMVHVANHLSNYLNYVYDKKYGYLNSCPSNIGTALRASVLIKLPKMSKKIKELEKIAHKYNLQVRGLYGENSKLSDSDTFDISNEVRLGETEVNLINKMILGVAEIIQEEKNS